MRVAVSAWRTALRVWFAALVRAALALLDFVARVDLRLRAPAPVPCAAAGSRAGALGGGGSRAGAREPLRWILQLGGAGKALRGAPGARQGLWPCLARDGVAETPAELVLAELQLEAEQPLE